MTKHFHSIATNDQSALATTLNNWCNEFKEVKILSSLPAQGNLGQIMILSLVEFTFDTEEQKTKFLSEKLEIKPTNKLVVS